MQPIDFVSYGDVQRACDHSQRSSTRHCKCCKIKVVVNQLILPVCTAGLVEGHSGPMSVGTSLVLLSSEVTERGYDRHPSVDWTLGAATIVTPACMNLWARYQRDPSVDDL